MRVLKISDKICTGVGPDIAGEASLLASRPARLPTWPDLQSRVKGRRLGGKH